MVETSQVVEMVALEIERSGLSDYELEKLTGIGRSNIRRWRRCEVSFIRRSNLKALASALGKHARFGQNGEVEFLDVGPGDDSLNPLPGYLPEGSRALQNTGVPGIPLLDMNSYGGEVLTEMGMPNPDCISGEIPRPHGLSDIHAYALTLCSKLAPPGGYLTPGDHIVVSPVAAVKSGDLVLAKRIDGALLLGQVTFSGDGLEIRRPNAEFKVSFEDLVFYHKVVYIGKQ